MREAGRWTGVVVATTLSGALWVGAEQASVEGRADVGDTELYYQLRGRGRTVVLLHGGLLDGRMWDGQFELLAQTYRVLRYDARGHGRSGPIEGEHCHYRDLHVLLATLGIEKATLVGLSLGARTAVDFTLEHPDMVEALVAVAPGISGWEFDDPVLLEHQKGLRAAAEAGDEAGVVEWFQRSWTDGPRRAPDDIDAAVREKVRSMARATVAKPGQRGPLVEAGAKGRLFEIDVPTLVMVGELDMADIHGISSLLAEKVQRARKIEVPGVAHMINMEAPEAFNRHLLAFLQTID